MAAVAVPTPVRRAMNWHRPLMYFAVLMAVSTVLSVGGLVLDDRTMTGEPIWLKPWKFSVSFMLYAVTWAWMISLQQRPRRWVWWSSTVIACAATLEMAIVIGQVIRGRASHFNAATAFDATLFRFMGILIVVLWLLNMAQGVVLLRDRLPDRPVAWAIRLGVVVGSVGIGLALLMLGPTPEQEAVLRDGGSIVARGAHSVGVPDGGPSMPITGWSTTGGDLRIPHFVGIHAMQALPLFAFALTAGARRFARLADEAVRTRLVIVAGAAYTGLLGLVTWQALRGQALIDPDGWTLGALAGLAVLVGLAARRTLSTVAVRR